MSFILDALRKSEQERQRNKEPGVAELQTHGKRSNRAFWGPLVMLLVGLNISLLVFLWIKGSPAPADGLTGPDSAANQPLTESLAPVLPAAVPSVRENQPARRLSEEIPAGGSARQAPATPGNTAPRDASMPAAAGSDNDYRNLPSLMELTLAGSLSLKPLHLDIHVFSEQPANRFVFINTTKYREGDTLAEGPRVDAITPRGVVLEYQGRNFILARE